ncbi:hypothetical protein HFK18_13005|uniref:hypothetical protein n=1 Tax=Stenotrophomonas sp. SbOxS2 TaxID=2723885 RepID=UPI0015D18487|nr:hypothetical protein [Stenotrophomonas sp. SbOxS2]NYT99400.1 hypothetical protein [Stenotrophomonas sp. SbOxS2]
MRKEGSAQLHSALAKVLAGFCALYLGTCKIVFKWLSTAYVDGIILAFYRAADDKDAAVPSGLSKVDFAAWIRANNLRNALIIRLPSAAMAAFVRTMCPVSNETAGRIHPAGGAVVAIPHFAEFIPAIISVALCAPADRRVAIFYESPDAVATNAVFNRVAERTIPQLERDVVICHNNASGLVAALRVIRSGGTLIIMPDVVKDSSLGTAMPFLSRSFVAMTGIGSIVRKTAVPLIPIIPRTPFDASLTIGAPVIPATPAGPVDDAGRFTDYIDYCIMRKMFENMSATIGGRQAFWTYWLSYSAPFQLHENPPSGDGQVRSLLKDPWLSAHTRPIVDVSTTAHD